MVSDEFQKVILHILVIARRRHDDAAIHYSSFSKLLSIMRDQYNSIDYSIGVIAYCQTQSDIKYLLIHHTKWHWWFPKGHTEWNEEPKQTALRELSEETWVTQVTLGDEIYTEYYQFMSHGKPVDKQVDYYLGHCNQCWSTTIQPEETIEAWRYNYEDAIKIITFDPARNLLKKVHNVLS